MADNFIPDPELEIRSIRKFKSPIQLVFKAFSEPQYLKTWWGPKGFTNSFHEFDFRNGGRWRFTMHGPDKGNYENECEFTEITEPVLISWKRFSKPLFRVAIHLEEVSGSETRLIFRMIFETAEECRKIKTFAVDKNEENFDRLEKVLESMKFNTQYI